METKRTHPLIITAAVAVILASGIAIASMTGLLPSSNANMSDQEIAQLEEEARLEEEAKAKEEAAAKKAASKPVASKPAPVRTAATCSTCGRVVEIRQRTVQGEGSGIGAVAGGVVGGLLGNQIGGGSGKKPFRKEGEHEEVSSGESLAEMTPRQRRLARNKVVSQSRKRGAPGKVTGTIGGTPKLPEGFDLEKTKKMIMKKKKA